MGYNTKCSVFGSAMAQLKLCFSFKFNPLWFPFSVFIFQVMYTEEHKNDKECFCNVNFKTFCMLSVYLFIHVKLKVT